MILSGLPCTLILDTLHPILANGAILRRKAKKEELEMIDDMIGLYPAPDTLLQRAKPVTGLWRNRRKGSDILVANCVQSRIKEYVLKSKRRIWQSKRQSGCFLGV